MGVSAGGPYIQHFARRHPRGVVAALAMNPEAGGEFYRRSVPLLSKQQRAEDQAYNRGGNDQGIDYLTSAEEMAADGPLRVPLTIMQSDGTECEDEICTRTQGLYTEINGSLVRAAGKGGGHLVLKARRDLYPDQLDKVIAEVDRLAGLARP